MGFPSGSLEIITVSVTTTEHNHPEMSQSGASDNVVVWQGMSDFNTSDHALDLVGFVISHFFTFVRAQTISLNQFLFLLLCR